ncbi:MAG: hemerythrin family protein [Candidatus Thiodiazotropha sp.]
MPSKQRKEDSQEVTPGSCSGWKVPERVAILETIKDGGTNSGDRTMPIVWREQLSVHNDIIDQDHKYLICLINSVELVLKHEDTIEYLPMLVDQLIDYTRIHFEREEKIQKKALFPLVSEHKRQHAEILEKLSELKTLANEYVEHLKNGQFDQDEDNVVTCKIMELARRWIVEHLVQEDKRMEYYLQKLPRSFS